VTMSQIAGSRFPGARSGRKRSGSIQQWGTVVSGGALAIYGLTRRSAVGIALATGGGALAYYAVRSDPNRRFNARSTIQLNCSREDAFRFWRDFENLPRFMRHLDSVRAIDDRRSKWTAIGPVGTPISWEAEIAEERLNELIAWRSVPDSDVEVHGRVEFRNATGDRGTILDVSLNYLPPAGALGRAVAQLLGKDPTFLMHQDLRRFKALIETGEIPTTDGQSHGPRDRRTAVIRFMDPDRPHRRDSRLTEVLSAERRVS
jgi:uncharacterized membrane protein